MTIRIRFVLPILGLVLVASCTNQVEPRASAERSPAEAPFPTTIGQSSVRSASYDVPGVASFASGDLVSKVVTGVVTTTEPVVYGGEDVYTQVTIKVDGAEPGEPKSITTREPGGVVKLKQVRSVYAGHVRDEVLDRFRDQPVTFVSEDDPNHSKVGQRVTVLLGGEPDDVGGYFSAATLVQKSNGKYVWLQSGPPNPMWGNSFAEESVERVARRH